MKKLMQWLSYLDYALSLGTLGWGIHLGSWQWIAASFAGFGVSYLKPSEWVYDKVQIWAAAKKKMKHQDHSEQLEVLDRMFKIPGQDRSDVTMRIGIHPRNQLRLQHFSVHGVRKPSQA